MEPEKASNVKIDKKTEKLKKVFLESALSTTIHGLPNIFRSERILLKIMWTLCLLGFSSYCFFSIFKSVNSYLNHEVVTNIDIIKENPTEFPAVTICNLNLFVTDYALDKLKKFKKDYLTVLPINEKNYLVKPKKIDIRKEFQEYSMNPANADRKNYSYPFEDTLIECNFDSIDCTADDFDWHYDPIYGNCFAFNKGQNFKGQSTNIKNSSRAGNMFGLSVQFFIGLPSKVDEMIQSTGIYVNIHNKSLQARPEMGVYASGGEQTNIIIERVFDQILPYPFSNCLLNSNTIDALDSEYYRAIFRSNKTYIQHECQNLCLNDELIKKCKCVKFIVPSQIDKKLCDVMNKCVQEVTQQFDSNQILRCVKLCPPDCNTISYSLSTSHSDYPTPKYAESLIRLPVIKSKFPKDISNNITNVSFKIYYYEFKRSVVSIKVFYGELKYTIVSQIPKMSFEDLISNVGGILGLFLGASFLSLVEIIEVALLGIFIILPKIKTSTKVFEVKNLPK